MYINDIPSINHPESFKLRKADHHLTISELQKAYPDRFVICQSEEEAKQAAKGHKHAYISRLFDYHHKDIVPFGSLADDTGKRTRFKPRDGAKKIYQGWMVSYPSLRLKNTESENTSKAISNW